MFAEAYKIASIFTQPVVVSMRFFDGTTDCNVGAFIIVNDEGWIITVAHLWGPFLACQQHVKELAKYREQLEAIERDTRLEAKQRRKKMERLQPNPKWITNHSFWWGRDGVQVRDAKIVGELDLAIGRLDPFDPASVETYPVFKDPEKLDVGTSLCKLGYPFHKIEATYDEANNAFKLSPNALPIPRFPIEGIYTRNARLGKSQDGKYDIEFLETSSPGLRGQSGGPIFDVNGTVWAIQSRTHHFPLGFSPKVSKGGREVEENQFLNVGWGVHPRLIIAFLRDNGIKFNLSEY